MGNGEIRHSGREIAGLLGDAIMASLEDAVARLHRAEPVPDDSSGAGGPDGRPPPEARTGESEPVRPGRVAADLIEALTAEIVQGVLRRIDLNATLEAVDVQRLVDRVDVQRIVDRVDADALVRRVDVDAIVARLDVDALVAGVDVDAVVQRIDIAALTREALEAVDIGEILRESTATIGSDIVETLRWQGMRADDAVARLFDRVLRRREPRRTILAPPVGPG